jgi:protein-L-isoaspartate(D-aspartate) O-methyltransferase
MAEHRRYQEQFLKDMDRWLRERPLSAAARAAYLATPRHRFIHRYRLGRRGEWQTVDETNEPQLAVLYENRPLILATDGDTVLATISQPGFVLNMIDRLGLQPGHSVFELGTASGWNAALMAHAVGPQGSVTSVEILPELAESATRTVRELGLANIHIVQGDGGDGLASNAPYDRAIFTAGTYDLPRAFYAQLKEGGLLLVVIKVKGGGDALFLLKKVGHHFESIESASCAFVPVTGKYAVGGMDPVWIGDLPEWSSLTKTVSSQRRFWWGAGGWPDNFQARTIGFRGFLGISEPARLGVFQHEPDKEDRLLGFGLWGEDRRDLTLARNDDFIITYATGDSEQRFRQRLDEWFSLGMPDLSCFRLRAYPIDAAPPDESSGWTTRHSESVFHWVLDT